VLGTPVADDVLVYEEQDDSFYMGIGRTRDDKYITIGVHSTVSSEERYAPAADPANSSCWPARARRGIRRRPLRGRWVIRTNADGAKNFKIVTAPDDASSRAQWTDWLAHDDKVFIDGFELFGASPPWASVRGLERIRLIKADGSQRVREGRRAGRIRWAWAPTPSRYRPAALRLHLDDHAGHHLRAER
jgi:oligopeptidase B